MYKIVFIDLDGTLLNDEKRVSEEDIMILNKAYEEKGLLPVVTTGRLLASAEYVANIIGDCCKKYIIAANGAIVKKCDDNTYITEEYISKEHALDIIQYCKNNNLEILVADRNETITEDKGRINDKAYARIGVYYNFEENIERYIKNNDAKIATITAIGGESKLNELREHINKMNTLQVSNICEYKRKINGQFVTHCYVDIMRKGFTKAEGMSKLLNMLNIKKEEAIAIGDGGNDLEMYEKAGLKVAMSNSVDLLKRKADYITASNNESGVAKAIKKYIFNM